MGSRRGMCVSSLYGLAVLILCPTVGSARTWHVPAEAPTVQAGIDSAQAGDDVRLAPGVYTWTSENASGSDMIRMKAGVWLHSESGAASTILDAESRGRVILCRDVGDQARIEGLTVRGGGTSILADLPAGAGILALGISAPIIRSCVIRDNTSSGDADPPGTGGYGGGISCDVATIEGCEFGDNRATGGVAAGGAIWCSPCIIRDCVFRANGAEGEDAFGGAVASHAVTMTGCTFEANTAVARRTASGGAISDDGCPSIESCTFTANSSVGSTGGSYGGAVSLDCQRSGAASPNPGVHGCLFVRNHADGTPSRFSPAGGALRGLQLGVTGCVFVANTIEPAGFGGAIQMFGGSVEHCTLLGNSNSGSSAALSMPGAAVRSCIVAYHPGPVCDSPLATFSCSDFFGNADNGICGTDAGNNFSLDPQFCAVDPLASLNTSLQQDSPCAPGNHPGGSDCGTIGASPVGCASTSVQSTSWSSLKLRYR